MCASMLQAGLDTVMPRLLTRRAFGQPLADQQGLQWQLADVATDMRAARLLAYDAARLIESSGAAAEAAAHAKKFATRVAFNGLSACMQAMGADGLKQDYPLARHLSAAKMAHYLDGTTEIQNVVIARALRKHYADRGQQSDTKHGKALALPAIFNPFVDRLLRNNAYFTNYTKGGDF